jgi:hypothetical protein
METQNFTVRLPKDLIRKAKILAARRDTSVSALLTEKLKEIVEHDVDGLARDELGFLRSRSYGTTRISDVLRRTLGAGALEYQTAWAHWQDLVQTLRLSNEGRPYPSRDEAHER